MPNSFLTKNIQCVRDFKESAITDTENQLLNDHEINSFSNNLLNNAFPLNQLLIVFSYKINVDGMFTLEADTAVSGRSLPALRDYYARLKSVDQYEGSHFHINILTANLQKKAFRTKHRLAEPILTPETFKDAQMSYLCDHPKIELTMQSKMWKKVPTLHHIKKVI